MTGSEFQEIWRALHDFQVRIDNLEGRVENLENQQPDVEIEGPNYDKNSE